MAEGTIVVRGLRDLQKAFALAGKEVKGKLTAELREAARPVADAASHRAVEKLSHLREGDPWSEFRVGVTQRLVYVVPQQRGRRRKGQKRPKFADLVQPEMDAALEQNANEVAKRVDDFLGDVTRIWEDA